MHSTMPPITRMIARWSAAAATGCAGAGAAVSDGAIEEGAEAGSGRSDTAGRDIGAAAAGGRG
ncbi:hypothetical protein GCM10009078_05570 [Cupriavidus gilardii]